MPKIVEFKAEKDKRTLEHCILDTIQIYIDNYMKENENSGVSYTHILGTLDFVKESIMNSFYRDMEDEQTQ